jgi:broad specificity phosphatase PhoE
VTNPAEVRTGDDVARPGLPPLVGPIVHRALLVPQPGVTHLLLVRHGQPTRAGEDASRDAKVDPPLSERGQRQAEAVADALASEALTAVYSSGLRRARETGAAVGARHGLEPIVWDELREFEGFRDVPDGESVRAWVPPALMEGLKTRFVRERRWDAFPFSEPREEFRNRVASAMEGILGSNPGGRVVVACHGGVINAYLAHLWDTHADMLFNPAHGSISRIVAREDRRAIHTLNELHHLGELVDY